MNWSFPHRWLALAAIGCCLQAPIAVGGDAASTNWNGIQRLSVDFLEADAAPFLELHEPAPVIEQASAQQPASEPARPRASVTAIATSEPRHAQDSRSEMRNTLLKEGQASAADRDELTAEVFSVMKWTGVTLMIGCVAVFGLKRFPKVTQTNVVGNKMAIVETLTLGRHQTLNLVQAGGERFLVAADAAGIKSVTLLPNWPGAETELEETSPSLKVFSPRMDASDDSQADADVA
ncbi:flagellar biosynthetic protein FliO [Planctomicrobium piriforme]|uniref:Flagellar biosynthesis protein, FliO n=1 Tax=Planctomicrobium piriforme TaxID=1576369 RepID=A0A1I3HLT6_9PLAN|nr:flagellar biosynthetic protein FliO [Planctomicrobium piriforme]SFI36706.1 Flagellar biosynthesis protein, FliO [Planctomicrobium piriforme]